MYAPKMHEITSKHGFMNKRHEFVQEKIIGKIAQRPNSGTIHQAISWGTTQPQTEGMKWQTLQAIWTWHTC